MILIGTNNWKLAVSRRIRKEKWNDPIASKCILGWGHCKAPQAPKLNFPCTTASATETRLKRALKRVFALKLLLQRRFVPWMTRRPWKYWIKLVQRVKDIIK